MDEKNKFKGTIDLILIDKEKILFYVLKIK